MPISIQCGGCAKKYKAPDKAAGKKVKCEKCGHIIVIPAKESAKQRPETITLVEEEPAEIVEFVETESDTYSFGNSPPPRSRKPAAGKRKPRKKVSDDDWEDDAWEDDTSKPKPKSKRKPKKASESSDDEELSPMQMIGGGVVCLIAAPCLYYFFRGLENSSGSVRINWIVLALYKMFGKTGLAAIFGFLGSSGLIGGIIRAIAPDIGRKGGNAERYPWDMAIGMGVSAVILLVGWVGMKVVDGAKNAGPPTVASGNTPSTPYTPPGNRPAAPGARPGGAARQPTARPPVKPALSPGRGLFRQVQEFSAVEQQFRYLSMSADGKRVIALISGNSVYVWEQGSAQPKARYDSHQARPDIAVLLPDGKRALSGGYKEIFIWDIATQKGLVRYEGHRTSMKAVAFTPDSKLVFSASGLRGIHVWEADTGKPLGKLQGHRSSVQAMVVTPDGSKLVSSDGYEVRHWATNDFRELKVIPVRERPYNFSTIAAGGQRALFSDLSSVDIWDLENNKPVVKVQARPAPNSGSMAVSADGSRAVIATGKQVLVWDVTNGKDVDRFDGDPIAVHQVAISADGKRIASAGYGKTIRLWELKAGR